MTSTSSLPFKAGVISFLATFLLILHVAPTKVSLPSATGAPGVGFPPLPPSSTTTAPQPEPQTTIPPTRADGDVPSTTGQPPVIATSSSKPKRNLLSGIPGLGKAEEPPSSFTKVATEAMKLTARGGLRPPLTDLSRDVVPNDANRSAILALFQKHGSKDVIPAHADEPCISLLRDVVVHPLHGLRLKHGRGNAPTCTIDGTKPGRMPISRLTAEEESSWGIDKLQCRPMAVIGPLYRPHHAMQFLFALMGPFAASREFGLSYKTVPFHATVMRYAAVGDYRAWNEDTGVDENGKEITPASSSSSPHTMKRAFLRLRELVSDEFHLYIEKEWKNYVIRPPPSQASSVKCYRAAVYGALPLRIPMVYPMKARRGILNKMHFRWMKERMIDKFGLKVLPLEEQHVLYVIRKTRARTILNEAQLIRWVNQTLVVNRTTDDDNRKLDSLPMGKATKLKVVAWEGMSLPEMLQIAINSRSMIGTHGNGLAWSCFMDKPEEAFMLEFSSQISLKNEVKEGINIDNAGNVASFCGVRSLSLLCPWKENQATKIDTHPGHKWKNVDLRLSEAEFRKMNRFVETEGREMR